MTSEQTLNALNHAIANSKNAIDKAFYQGVIALVQENLDDAKTAFHKVLSEDKSHTDARTNLGVIALRENRAQEAITYFSEALGYDENHENARNNLAATFIHHARFENALTHYKVLIETCPDNIEYRYNTGVAEMALGHLKPAKAHFLHVLTLSPKHSAALTNLASIATRHNQTQDAIQYLERAHKANPTDTSSQFMLDALKGNPRKEASFEYAKNLFDNYALHYEKHMNETLNYQTPQHITAMLHKHLPNLHTKRALDLGCGTGLSGIIMRELSEHLTGVDLSPQMLLEAKRKSIYDELIEADINDFFKTKHQPFSLIVAADVLPYFGELNTLFEHIQKQLTQTGFFVITHEITKTNPYLLQKTARFAHHPDYIHTTAKENGLIIQDKGEYIARKHHDKDLPVMLYVLQKT